MKHVTVINRYNDALSGRAANLFRQAVAVARTTIWLLILRGGFQNDTNPHATVDSVD